MAGYEDLAAWQKSMDLVTKIYRVTQGFPREELYGLTSQIRRAAVSIPSNLAEGHSRNSSNEYRQFVGHARGFLAEVETQLKIAENLGYIKPEAAIQLFAATQEVGRILTGLKSSLDRRVGSASL
jgi:four helix bundle protein